MCSAGFDCIRVYTLYSVTFAVLTPFNASLGILAENRLRG